MAAPSTPERILDVLRDGPRQAHEIADLLGIDTSAVRRHLDIQVREGLVTFHDHVEGPGRPKRRYGITTAGHERFHRDYAFLTTALLDAMRASLGPKEVRRLMAGIAATVAKDAVRTGRDRAGLDRLVETYNTLGFEARLETAPGTTTLVQRNCPFLAAARHDPQALCECLDQAMIRSVAPPGADVALERCMAVGDTDCRHVIRLKPLRRRNA